jgi:hypothetical protein
VNDHFVCKGCAAEHQGECSRHADQHVSHFDVLSWCKNVPQVSRGTVRLAEGPQGTGGIDLAATFHLTDFKDLEQPMRSWALVGCYVGNFAFLESAVLRCITEVSGIDGLAAVAIGRNMGAMEKVRALRTLTNLALIGESKNVLDALLRRAVAIVEERNVVAHSSFGASTASDGVSFFTVDAKRNLRFEDIDWPLQTFEKKIDEIREVTNALDHAENLARLRAGAQVWKTSRASVAKALLGL